VRESALVDDVEARCGGDEFVVWMDGNLCCSVKIYNTN